MSFFRYGREKIYGSGRSCPCDAAAKRAIMARARSLMKRTKAGRAWGSITPKTLAVLEALVWRFHNAKSGLCFPSIKTIAAAVGCSPATVQEALRRLESLGLISWVHRLKRVTDRLGRTRPVRTSNGYRLHPPAIDARDAKSSRPATDASLRHGTQNQGLFSWERRAKKSKAPAEKRSDDLSDFVLKPFEPKGALFSMLR